MIYSYTEFYFKLYYQIENISTSVVLRKKPTSTQFTSRRNFRSWDFFHSHRTINKKQIRGQIIKIVITRHFITSRIKRDYDQN